MAITNALVVDDSRLARLTLTRLLEKRSIEVNKVSSAQEAFEALKSRRPDLILMDVTMPDIDGLEATRMITNNPDTAAIPVVMCTAEDSDEAREKAQACGATAFLTKPAGDDNLDRVLEEIARQIEQDEPAPATAVPEQAPDAPVATPQVDLELIVDQARVAAREEARQVLEASEPRSPAGDNVDMASLLDNARQAAREEFQRVANSGLKEMVESATRSASDALRTELEASLQQGNQELDENRFAEAARAEAMKAIRESASTVVQEAAGDAVAAAVTGQMMTELEKATRELENTIRDSLGSQLNTLLNSEGLRNRLQNAGTQQAGNEARKVAEELSRQVARETARESASEVARTEVRLALEALEREQVRPAPHNDTASKRALVVARLALAASGLALTVTLALGWFLY